MTWGTLFQTHKGRMVLGGGALAAGLAVIALVHMLTYPKTATDALNRGFYGAARDLLAKSAHQGSAEAQNQLGNLLYLGLGGARNHRQAAQWYLKSAAQADASAQVNIARMYREGLGVKQDVIRAFGWLRQARINGNEFAENQMRWIAGSLSLGPNQMQLAKDKYGTLESLLPKDARP